MTRGSKSTLGVLLVGLLLGETAWNTQAWAAEILPAGNDINNAVALNMTQEGIDFIEAQIPALVPDTLPAADITGVLFSCWPFPGDEIYAIKDITAYLQVQSVQIEPKTGYLDLTIDALVSADARVETSGCLINTGCEVHIG